MSMTEPTTTTTPGVSPDDVTFTAFGSERKTMPWRTNLTVQDVLNHFDASKKWRQRLLLNGKKANGGSVVPKGATIVLSSAVSNG